MYKDLLWVYWRGGGPRNDIERKELVGKPGDFWLTNFPFNSD
jgi:hypothetical protein